MSIPKTFSQIIQNNNQCQTSEQTPMFKYHFDILKSEADQQLVFGWANVAVRPDGEQIEDYQEDIIDIADLEAAAYEFVINYRQPLLT